MNEKFQYRTRPPSAVLKHFEFIVSELVQVNPDNSRAMSALTFLLCKLNERNRILTVCLSHCLIILNNHALQVKLVNFRS